MTTKKSPRDADLEVSVGLLTEALYQIANGHDCDYVLERERPDPCPCARCVAKRAVERVGDWRYLGARSGRTRTNPRERKMVAAWRAEVGDAKLAQVLADDSADPVLPTVRDWFVASTVVQWLATNVGMEVLRKAGFEYAGWEADRLELKMKEEKR